MMMMMIMMIIMMMMMMVLFLKLFLGWVSLSMLRERSSGLFIIMTIMTIMTMTMIKVPDERPREEHLDVVALLAATTAF